MFVVEHATVLLWRPDYKSVSRSCVFPLFFFLFLFPQKAAGGRGAGARGRERVAPAPRGAKKGGGADGQSNGRESPAANAEKSQTPHTKSPPPPEKDGNAPLPAFR